MVAEKVGGAIEIPLEALETPLEGAHPEPSSHGEADTDDSQAESEPEPPPPPRPGRKRKRKGGGGAWVQSYQVDLTQLDLHGLLQAMDISVGPRGPYMDATRFRCGCIRPEEHTDGKDDDGAFVIEKAGEFPVFHCSHSTHCGELGLKHVLESAGNELVAKFAPPLDQEDLPPVSGGVLRRTNSGIFFYSDEEDRPPHLVCSQLRFKAMVRDKDNGEWGVLCIWRDYDGYEHQEHIPRQALKGDGTEVRGQLLSGGCQVSTTPKGRGILLEMLNRVSVPARARFIPKTGWHGDAFVLPNEVIGGDPGELLVLDSRRRPDHGFQCSGTLAEWQAAVGEPAPASRLVV